MAIGRLSCVSCVEISALPLARQVTDLPPDLPEHDGDADVPRRLQGHHGRDHEADSERAWFDDVHARDATATRPLHCGVGSVDSPRSMAWVDFTFGSAGLHPE